MGLDMYLFRKSYVKNWDHTEDNDKHDITIKKGGKLRTDINPKNIAYIVEEIMYWRKANAIHGFFVKNVQDGVDDCKSYWVDIGLLKDLLKMCKKDLKYISSTRIANIENLNLRPTEGFFFGSQEIDEGFIDDLKYTEIELTKIIKEDNGDFYYEYSSSW